MTFRHSPVPIRVLTSALCILSFAMFAPLWLPIVFAAWTADIIEPVTKRFEKVLGNRTRAAWVVLVLLVVFALLPLVVAGTTLASGGKQLYDRVRSGLEGNGPLVGVLLGNGGGGPAAAADGAPVAPADAAAGIDWAGLVGKHGAKAWQTLSVVAKASTAAAVGILVYLTGLYTFITEGTKVRAWLEDHAPISREAFSRLSKAFYETGRGLIVAGGGTALVQGLVAAIAYVALGIPRAVLFGLLTVVCALVPFVGTALVWIPLAIELAAAGSPWRAGILVAVGLFVSIIDNIVRPAFARYGKLTLPTYVVLVSMLGGIALLGAPGAILAPLVIRLCVEALAIMRTARPAIT